MNMRRVKFGVAANEFVPKSPTIIPFRQSRSRVSFSVILVSGLFMGPVRADIAPVGTAPVGTASVGTAPVGTQMTRFPTRGRILDRRDRALVEDKPCLDLKVPFVVLEAWRGRTGDGDFDGYVDYLAKKGWKSVAGARDILDSRQQVQESLELTADEFATRIEQAVASVHKIRDAAERRSGVRVSVTEERTSLLLQRIQSLKQMERISTLSSASPWIQIEEGFNRVRYDEGTMSHILGRASSVNMAGVEGLMDDVLRVPQITEGQEAPIRDVQLTLDLGLQIDSYRILGQAVEASKNPAGGALVVVELPGGEVRALVSYPAPGALPISPTGGGAKMKFRSGAEDASPDGSPSGDGNSENKLARNHIRLPWLFRAVSGLYSPGSTGKAVSFYGAYRDGAISDETRVTCRGPYFENSADSFRCWLYNQSREVHGQVDAIEAIRYSCNCFFFHIGESMGAERIVSWYGRFGLGSRTGIGLQEESAGILPDQSWLTAHRPQEPRFIRSDALNFAIGQGEVTVTPVQCANVAATVARGAAGPVILVRGPNNQGTAPASRAESSAEGLTASGSIPAAVHPGEPLDARTLNRLRTGMWEVVNRSDGTAVAARGIGSGHVLCGKTGSAETQPRVLSWSYRFQDGAKRDLRVQARSREEADELARQIVKKSGVSVSPGETLHYLGRRASRTFPALEPGDPLPSHAWFIGYTQAAEVARGGSPVGKVFALAVLIEFGGSGGKVAAPVAREVATRLVRSWRSPGSSTRVKNP